MEPRLKWNKKCFGMGDLWRRLGSKIL